MRKGLLLAALLGVAVAACAAGSADFGTPVRDRDIGLSKTSVLDAPAPDPVMPSETEPGDGPPLARSHPGFPPRVPHGMADFLPITRGDNACLDCHAVEVKEEGEPTPMPESHYVDLRNAPGEAGEEVAGARYYCSSCHVGVTSAPLLMENLHAE